MKLYHVPGSRSCRVMWLLEELGLDYDVEVLSATDGSQRSPEYRALNPLGRVPTFTDQGVSWFESGAIVQLLLERYGEGRLAPAVDSPDRPLYLQWFHFGEATLIQPIVSINSNRFVLREADRSERALSVARRQLARFLAVLDDALGRTRGEGPYLLGESFTAADVMTGYSVTLASLVGELPDEPENVHAWLARLRERPAYQATFAGGFGGS